MRIVKLTAVLLTVLIAGLAAGYSRADADPAGSATAVISRASVSVSSDLTLHIGAQVSDGVTAPVMIFERAGRQTSVSGTKDEGLWKFEYGGICPQCMADPIRMTLTDGGTVLAEMTYSVREYFDDVHGSEPSELGLNEEQFNTLVTLMADALEYGAMAQAYSGYNASDPANSLPWVSSEKTQNLSAPVSDEELTIPGTSSDYIADATLCLDSYVRLRFRVKAQEADRLQIDSENGRVTVLLSDYEVRDGYYEVYSRGLSATEFDTVWGIMLIDSRQLTYSRIEYSVNSYIAAVYDSGNARLSGLVRALYRYGASAGMYRSVLSGSILTDDHEWGPII